MSGGTKKERLRGMKEGRSGVEALQSLWPLAFPKKSHLVRPLSSGIVEKIVERTGWNPAYTRGVLQSWKMRDRYCEAVLRYDRRSNLDGEETAETVSDIARKMARERLATLAARRLKREQERAAAQSNPETNDSSSPGQSTTDRRADVAA
jgi:sRNA-binding protein